ncbi:MAG: hypothetical protein KJO43_06215 [Phycisphaerae bacterium]|nr:hypothetical protein [Phycisphaerae bacterium]
MLTAALTTVFLAAPPVTTSAAPPARAVHEEKLDQPPGPPAAARDETHPPRVMPAVGNLFAPVQVNIDAGGNNIVGDAANEPSIAVDPTAPNRLAIGWRQFATQSSNFRQAGVAYSHDGGRTWTNNGPLQPAQFRSDPVLSADQDGTMYYYSLSSLTTCEFFLSDDGGVSWSSPIPAFGGDKQWFVLDECEGKGRSKVYAYWSIFAGCCGQDTFIRSFDGAQTFTPPAEILETPVFGTLAVGPDRELYIGGIDPSDFSQYVVTRLEMPFDPDQPADFDATIVDLGGSMLLGAGPNPQGLLGQAWIAVDTSGGVTHGNLYLLGSNQSSTGSDPMDVRIARSLDGGQTWGEPVRVNDDASSPSSWQWFGTMSVAPNGRIDVIWNDTREDAFADFSRLYYANSTDGGQTFSENVALTLPFNHFKGYPMQNKLGDYYEMVSDDVGAHVAFAATFNDEQDVYYLRIGDYDCNGNGVGDAEDIAAGDAGDCNDNGIPDSCEIAAGTVLDRDGDGVPDECVIAGDVDGDGDVDFNDLLLVLAAWGDCPDPPAACPADVDGDGTVGFPDLLMLLANWTV